MPNRSDDSNLQSRFNKLEDKFDRHSADLQSIGRNLGQVEGKTDSHSGEIQKLEAAVGEIRKLVLERTSATRAVTWNQLLMFAGFFVFVMGPLISILAAAANAWILPGRIEHVVTNSDKVKNYFVGIVDSRLDEKLKPINQTLASVSTIDENIRGIRDDLTALTSLVKTTATRKGVTKAIHNHSSSRRRDYNLKEVRALLTAVQELKIPLERQDFKDLSMNLYLQYLATKEPEKKKELLETFIKAANAKSISEPTLHEIPPAVIAHAKASNNYFEGEVDLSSRSEWKGAVFNHCKIVISKPDVWVVLREVRFLDCSFDSLPDSPAVNLLSTYLETTRPTLRFLGYRVDVNYLGRLDQYRKRHTKRRKT